MQSKKIALSKDGIAIVLTEDEAQALANAIGKVEIAMGFDLPRVLREIDNTLGEMKIYRDSW